MLMFILRKYTDWIVLNFLAEEMMNFSRTYVEHNSYAVMPTILNIINTFLMNQCRPGCLQ